MRMEHKGAAMGDGILEHGVHMGWDTKSVA